jgi:hypothetical protein
MSDLDVFGPLVIWNDVGNAIVSTLQEWYPTYLERMCRKIGQPETWLPSPASYVVTYDTYHFPEDQPPVVVVSVPGTLDRPKRDGSRRYRAFWDVRITVFVTAVDRATTEALAGYYGGATTELILDKASLGNFAEGIEWHGTMFDTKISDRDQRTLGSCESRFSVDVRDVVMALSGPLTPTTSAPASWPTATDVKVQLAPNAIPE